MTWTYGAIAVGGLGAIAAIVIWWMRSVNRDICKMVDRINREADQPP